ncbi:MAG TPA: SGNH/GDSL hydrolase family protein [Candidatus Borkfalkia excrementipullorum]|nr:SGNH/GDSL hydrolase family protein [Candidatus Borkfalkia excrementipullorum]
MKRSICTLLACLLLLGCGCSGPMGGAGEEKQLAERGEWMEYTSYQLETWLRPFWNTREVYNETVLFVGEEDAAPLLYKPSEVVSVRDYGLQIEYVYGKDYTLTEDGKIQRIAGSSIPYFTVDEYYRTEPDSVPVAIFGDASGYEFKENRYIKYGEGNTFTSKQIAVTYTHDSPWNGSVPAGKSERVQAFLQKLQNKEKTTAVFYGDSITVGCNASGTEYGGNISPYTPSYPELVTAYLTKKYGAEIELINTAVGGSNTEWGVQNVQERVIAYRPDLVVIAFGMNDSSLPIAEYKEKIAEMVNQIHRAEPDCSIVLVATSVPNNETEWFYGNQKQYIAGLREMEEDTAYPFVAVADMTTFHLDLLDAGKRFRDMTGNNINHPNDFLVRAYAQIILKTMLGDNFTV